MQKIILTFVFLFQGFFSSLAFANSKQFNRIDDLTEDEFYTELSKELTVVYSKALNKMLKVKKQDEDKTFLRIKKQFERIEKKMNKQLARLDNSERPGLEEGIESINRWFEDIKDSKERGTLLEDLQEKLSVAKVSEIVQEIVASARSQDAFKLYKSHLKADQWHDIKRFSILTVLGGGLIALFIFNPVLGLVAVGATALFFAVAAIIVANSSY